MDVKAFLMDVAVFRYHNDTLPATASLETGLAAARFFTLRIRRSCESRWR